MHVQSWKSPLGDLVITEHVSKRDKRERILPGPNTANLERNTLPEIRIGKLCDRDSPPCDVFVFFVYSNRTRCRSRWRAISPGEILGEPPARVVRWMTKRYDASLLLPASNRKEKNDNVGCGMIHYCMKASMDERALYTKSWDWKSWRRSEGVSKVDCLNNEVSRIHEASYDSMT